MFPIPMDLILHLNLWRLSHFLGLFNRRGRRGRRAR